jgi:hypothetical protein
MNDADTNVPRRREQIVYAPTAQKCRVLAVIFKEVGIEVKNSNPHGKQPMLVVVATPNELQNVLRNADFGFEPNIKTLG